MSTHHGRLDHHFRSTTPSSHRNQLAVETGRRLARRLRLRAAYAAIAIFTAHCASASTAWLISFPRRHENMTSH
ncbi:hypothetical protein BDZ89DRAFT_1073799 [Hymenopellis radicata]|nr:hypothetical protein BDZ89DRAFT_1073799 [Hymenopellis radicata]